MERLFVVALGEADGDPMRLTPHGRHQMVRMGLSLYPMLKGHRVRLTTGDLRWMREASEQVGQGLKIVPDSHRSMRCEGDPRRDAIAIMGGLRRSSEPVTAVVALLASEHATALMRYAYSQYTQGQGRNWPPVVAAGDAVVLDFNWGSRCEVLGALPPHKESRAG